MNNFANRSNFSFEEQVDELVDNFTFLINREKETMREERDALDLEREQFAS